MKQIIFSLGILIAGAFELEAKNLYKLKVDLTDQEGQSTPLNTFEGYSTFVAMFYADCPMMCPTLIEDIKNFERQLSESQRKSFRVLLISFDPEVDRPEALQKVVKRHRLDLKHWKLANAKTDKKTRELATALGVKFRRQADKINYDHTAVINLIDPQGEMKGHWEGTDLSKTEKAKEAIKFLK